MPTYVYGCDTCGHRFETFQKFQDAPLTECHACGARVRRIFQPAGIVFKGSGWYSTDARSTRPARASSETADAAENGAEGSAPKTPDNASAPSNEDGTGKTPPKNSAKAGTSTVAKAAE